MPRAKLQKLQNFRPRIPPPYYAITLTHPIERIWFCRYVHILAHKKVQTSSNTAIFVLTSSAPSVVKDQCQTSTKCTELPESGVNWRTQPECWLSQSTWRLSDNQKERSKTGKRKRRENEIISTAILCKRGRSGALKKLFTEKKSLQESIWKFPRLKTANMNISFFFFLITVLL